MDCEEVDRDMQRKIDKWYEDALKSLDDREITNLAYEARDLEDIAEALYDLGNELWQIGHIIEGSQTEQAAYHVKVAARMIGAINGE